MCMCVRVVMYINTYNFGGSSHLQFTLLLYNCDENIRSDFNNFGEKKCQNTKSDLMTLMTKEFHIQPIFVGW